MIHTIQIIGFAGFYESRWTAEVENFIEDMRSAGLKNFDHMYMNTGKDFCNSYTDLFVKLVEKYLGVQLVRLGDARMKSPSQYNYSTDEIFFEAEIKTIEKIVELFRINVDKLEQIILNNHSSRDGFWSLMNAEARQWEQLILKDDRYLSYAIHYLLELNKDTRYYDWLFCEEIGHECYIMEPDLAKEYEIHLSNK